MLAHVPIPKGYLRVTVAHCYAGRRSQEFSVVYNLPAGSGIHISVVLVRVYFFRNHNEGYYWTQTPVKKKSPEGTTPRILRNTSQLFVEPEKILSNHLHCP